MTVEDLGQPVPTTPDGLEPSTGLFDMAELDFSQPSAIAPASTTAPAPAQAAAPTAPAEAPAEATAPPPRAPIVPPGPPAAVLAAQQAAKADKVVMPPTPPPAPTASRSNVSSSEPAIPLATCATIDSLTSSVVAHVNAHFEHAMLFTYDKAILRPSKWSELLLSVKGDNPDPISLEHASIFRIAARTSLPYHGYVVPNPTNMAFFNAFTRGIVPKHVTVMPIMIAGQLTGMLMGLSMADVDYKASLIAMEKIASDFSTQLERLKDRGTAAA
jgi:hypothetical protein